MQTIDNLKNSESGTVTGWTLDVDHGSWNIANLGSCGDDGSWFGFINGNAIGSISAILHGTGDASITFGNCWNAGHVKLLLDGNVISSAGPNTLITSEFHFEDSTIRLEEHNGAIIRFYDFEIPDCVTRKKNILSNRKSPTNISRKHKLIESIQSDHQKWQEMLPNPYFRIHPMYDNSVPTLSYNLDLEDEMFPSSQFRNKYIKRSRNERNITQHKANIGSTNTSQPIQLKSNCEGKGMTYQKSSIVCNHLASSVEGLRVKLNPNIEEYKTDAGKNNFIGFKYLVHSPYDFPYVEEVGKAMGPNIQSNIGFLGFHSWITDRADSYKPGQKNCASKDDIELDVFHEFTRANCVFECQARSIFKKCECLPYHYPEFHFANTGIWENVNSTACNYTQLICLSKVKGI